MGCPVLPRGFSVTIKGSFWGAASRDLALSRPAGTGKGYRFYFFACITYFEGFPGYPYREDRGVVSVFRLFEFRQGDDALFI